MTIVSKASRANSRKGSATGEIRASFISQRAEAKCVIMWRRIGSLWQTDRSEHNLHPID